ncbi:hypothetical protein EDD86DRAFT_205495 [Gorgonomyces haynaldii]|nr:hypothetical protein EDD86DRAFT_205495 [Gorgonomyces haynaldii]
MSPESSTAAIPLLLLYHHSTAVFLESLVLQQSHLWSWICGIQQSHLWLFGEESASVDRYQCVLVGVTVRGQEMSQ